MWVAKLKLRHDCIIGRRCRKFDCSSLGYPLESYKEGKEMYYLHLEKVEGAEKNIKRLIKDLKKDNNVKNMEVYGNVVFFSIKSRKGAMPAQDYTRKVFFLKPILVDREGYELWEIASWSRDVLNSFIQQLKKETYKLEFFKILRIQKTRLNEIYFPQIMPSLTEKQKRALELAIKEGYYDFPRRIEIRQLAKISKQSFSTFREHLRKAEKKVLITAQ